MTRKSIKNFKTFINENSPEQKVIEVTDCHKLDSVPLLVKKYNKPIKAEKSAIDFVYNSFIVPDVKKNMESLFLSIEKIAKDSKVESYVGESKEIKTKITNKILEATNKGYYAKYGDGQPLDYIKEITEIFQILYESVTHKLNGNLFYKNAMNLYITKKNVEKIVNDFLWIYNKYTDKVENKLGMIIEQTIVIARIKVIGKMTEGGKNLCTNIIVTVDSNCNKLPKNEQYYPPLEIEEKEGEFDYKKEDVEKIKNQYASKIEKIIRDAA
jgi:transcriptional regulator with PAS, ATPase and Fis domain